MKHSARLLMLAAGLALSFSAPVLADSEDGHWGRGMMGKWFMGEMMNHGMMEGWGPGMMMGGNFTGARLDELKGQLAITAEQTKLWDAYVDAVKSAATSMRGAHEAMMQGDPPEKLPERLAMHEAMMTARMESMKAVKASTLALYEALTPEQKTKADGLIAGMGMM